VHPQEAVAVTSTLGQAGEYRETFERVVRSFRLV